MIDWDSLTGEQIADEISKQNYLAEKREEAKIERMLTEYEAKHGPIDCPEITIDYSAEGDLF